MIEIEIKNSTKSITFHTLAKRMRENTLIYIRRVIKKEELILVCSDKSPNTHEWQWNCIRWGLKLFLKNSIECN